MAETDSIGRWLEAAGRAPLLTHREELELGRLVRAWQDWPGGANAAPAAVRRRGLRARERMASANLRLVATVARRYANATARLGLRLEDGLQEGVIGLLRAVEKFDPRSGYKFSTYGYWWIRQAINRYLQEHNSSIRMPVNLVSLANRAEALQSNGQASLNSTAIAQQLGESSERVLYALAVHHRSHTISLDQHLGGSDGDMTLLDTVSDSRLPSISDDYQWMHSQIELLSTPERTVIQLRYGEEQQRSFAEVARLTGRSKDQVQRLERHALTKLRRHLTPMLFPDAAGEG